MPGIQTAQGKAFEYAMLLALYETCSGQQEIVQERSAAFDTAYNSFNSLSIEERDKMLHATLCAAEFFTRMEPQLLNPQDNQPLVFKIQEDRQGRTGDVRDILTLRTGNDWEIGISCKHNHHAVKHSRLSPTIDFGADWLDHNCSPEYFAEITPIFAELSSLASDHVKWRDVEAKTERFYVPILAAFIRELTRLSHEYPEAPSSLTKYLIGRNDFYKVISNDKDCTTTIQGFNFNGTLNRAAGRVVPRMRVQLLSLPTRFYNIDFKNNSSTTIMVDCDHGWSISMRIHNADTYVESSLKFDVNLLGVPTNLFSHNEPWAER